MDDNTVNSLREALKFSPDNIPLRLHLADTLRQLSRLEEAEQEYQQVLKRENNPKATIGLAHIYYTKSNYATASVILEEYLKSNQHTVDALVLYTRCLLEENEFHQALETYQEVLALNPHFTDEELDEKLRVGTAADYNTEIDEYDIKFLQKPDIDFSHVGGMEAVKREIDLKIIQPLKHPEIYKSYGKKIGGGILLYGPPGCGKTYLAKATAGQINAKFISVSLNDILDMWMGSSERNLHEVFDLARRHAPCVLFFDEIDALGASRSDMRQSNGRHLINQFLQELDGIESNNDGVLVLGATNAPWHLDTAFRRPGRFDRIIFVSPPDATAREAILQLKLTGKPSKDINFKALGKKTQDYSGADLEAIIDVAIEGKLEDAIRTGQPQPIETKDLEQAIKRQKPTTKEWFGTAKNFALYANEAGLYDDVLRYLNIKK